MLVPSSRKTCVSINVDVSIHIDLRKYSLCKVRFLVASMHASCACGPVSIPDRDSADWHALTIVMQN